MTFETFQTQLLQCQTPEECDAFLRQQLHEIRPLFYGLTRAELKERRFFFADLFYQFANMATTEHMRRQGLPPSVLALLILFISFFERAGLFPALHAAANLLPPDSSLHCRVEAIFQYKNITDASSNYIARFNTIMGHLQRAWQDGTPQVRAQCEDLAIEYYAEAILESHRVGLDLREDMQRLFRDPQAARTFPFLGSQRFAGILVLEDEPLQRERAATRSRIVEALHAEACSLAPEVLLLQAAYEHLAEEIPDAQELSDLPDYLDARLAQLGARYNPQHQVVRVGLNADDDRNRTYLGTYFPRSFVEIRNILTELCSIPAVADAFAQKDVIRILDIGSGTGGSTTGGILAIAEAIDDDVPIEVTSLDGNADALAKQRAVLETISGQIPNPLTTNLIQSAFPTDIDGFVQTLQTFASAEGPKYDLVLFWKHLSEYYNTNYAQANGIVQHALQIASTLLVPNGLCCTLDLTTTDNGVEYFAMTLNREANAYDISPGATMTTILPLPCARHSRTCRLANCYTQRVFLVNHRLRRNDYSKVAYRVFAPNAFAASIVATYMNHASYRVNAHRPEEACLGGSIGVVRENCPSGYTGFFSGRRRQ